MTENLQIELLKQQITSIINETQLSAGIVALILQSITKEYTALYSQQLEKEYNEYQKTIQKEQNGQPEEE